MKKLNKKHIIEQFISLVQEEAEVTAKSANDAHDAATNEESKAENKYDTRGLEASYLAGAQAQRAKETIDFIEQFKKIPVQDYTAQDPIAVLAVVRADIYESEPSEPRKRIFFLTPQRGGMTLEIDGFEVVTLSPESPLGKAFWGKKQGENFEFSAGKKTQEFEITEVY